MNEEELNRSLRDNGNKNLKKKGSLNNSLSNNSKKLIEQMKSLKAEELIHEGYETFKKEEKSENEEENFPNTLSKKKDNLKKKVEKSQQTSSNANNLLKLEKKLKKTKDLTENPKDYENERENAMKKFYNSFALIEEGKFDRNGEKLYYSFDDKTTQQIEEKNSEIGSDSNESEERSQKPQTKRKKSRNKQKYFNDDENKLEKIIQSKLDKALLDPQIAKKWLKNQNYDKKYFFELKIFIFVKNSLDMNFLPKTLANNSLNNYKDSNERLKKKNDQLKVLMQNIDSDEDDSKRISKISKRSYITEKNVNVKSLEVIL